MSFKSSSAIICAIALVMLLSTGFNLAQAGFLTVSSLPSTMTPTSQVLAQSESHNKMLFKTQTVAANLGRKPPRTILTQSLTPAGPAVCPPYCPKNWASMAWLSPAAYPSLSLSLFLFLSPFQCVFFRSRFFFYRPVLFSLQINLYPRQHDSISIHLLCEHSYSPWCPLSGLSVHCFAVIGKASFLGLWCTKALLHPSKKFTGEEFPVCSCITRVNAGQGDENPVICVIMCLLVWIFFSI